MISLLKFFDRYKGKPPGKEMGLYFFHRYWRSVSIESIEISIVENVL